MLPKYYRKYRNLTKQQQMVATCLQQIRLEQRQQAEQRKQEIDYKRWYVLGIKYNFNL